MIDVSASYERVQRAIDADKLLWSEAKSGEAHRVARNRAVAEAARSGASLELIADKLGVRIVDVETMISAVTAR